MAHQPDRTCIGCRRVLKKEEVVRIIAGPVGVLIDYREKLDGRAAYVCPRQECISKALAKETLARALRARIRTPEADRFVAQLADIIKDKIMSLLSVAMKAGMIAAGFSAVRDAMEKGRVGILLYATDLSDGTREKVAVHGSGSLRQATLFTRAQLGGILNRELVGVVGILDKGLADALWRETQRLKGLINVSE